MRGPAGELYSASCHRLCVCTAVLRAVCSRFYPPHPVSFEERQGPKVRALRGLSQETLALVTRPLAALMSLSLRFLNDERKVIIPGLLDSHDFGREQRKLMRMKTHHE